MRKAQAALVVLVAFSSLVCASSKDARRPADPGAGEKSLLTRAVPARNEAESFPPPPSQGRHARGAMPTDFSNRSDGETWEPRVVEPQLDSEGSFDLVGDRFRLVFNQAMQIPERPKPAETPKAAGKNAKPSKPEDTSVDAAPGTLTIEPAIEGKARWLSPHTLEFVAARPLELGKTFHVGLGNIKTQSGEAFKESWKAKVVPRASVAGKILSYVPSAGQQRIVAVHPGDLSTVGKQPELAVLFDQAIDIAAARKLVHLEDSKGRPIPVSLTHPKRSNFQGIPVDSNFIVLVTPLKAFSAGEDYTLVAKDRFPQKPENSHKARFTIAQPLELQGMDCDGYGGEVCNSVGKKLIISGRRVRLAFNHRLSTADSELKKLVSISPPVRNLSVYSWGWDGGNVVLTGGFETSKTYNVSIAGITDVFGGRLSAPIQVQIETMPSPATLTMPTGVLSLDEAGSKRFVLTTKNVDQAEVKLWPVPASNAEAYLHAIDRVREGKAPDEAAPISIVVPVKSAHDRLIETPVNLLEKLSAGTTYLALAQIKKTAFGARTLEESGSGDSEPLLALITPGDAKTLAVHTRTISGKTLVHVARLGGGEPVAGAKVEIVDKNQASQASALTDANGIALMQGGDQGLLLVKASDAEFKLDLGDQGATSKTLFPALSSGAEPAESELRAMVMTDRGIYRPGSTVWIKANVRKADGTALKPVSNAEMHIRIIGPTGDEAFSTTSRTNDMGSIALSFAVPADAKLGRHHIRIEEKPNGEGMLADTVVNIAEFETPRFAVDVDAQAGAASKLMATVRGRYLFGAPMDGASVQWTIRRTPAPAPEGSLTSQGFVIRPSYSSWYDDEEEIAAKQTWTRAGESTLGPDGVFKLDQAISMEGVIGPQMFQVEADVSDSSYRHVAGKASVVLHPASRYAALRLKSRWIDTGGSVPIELGVVDTEGKTIADVPITAKLDRIEWKYAKRKGPGGSIRYEWSEERIDSGKCNTVTTSSVVSCNLMVPVSGYYRVTAMVDGRAGGESSFWAWRDGGDDSRAVMPSRGRTIEIVTDKSRYAPGETAKLLVHSPYPAATAIITTEQGGLLRHISKRMNGPAATFDIPIEAGHAPHTHAVVTLLPIGAKGKAIADYRIGAVRLPVSLSGARLAVTAKSAKTSYGPGEEAEINLEVQDNGNPEPNAEIALAVVDEGVLRLSAYHPPDPAVEFRPGRALSFRLRDSRTKLADLLEQSHVAGDGGETTSFTSTRRNFVETALWKPDVRTDAQGRAKVRFKLPDNLTQFRVMAVAVDDEGKGAAVESDFTVSKPILLLPAVPRFASLGDHFEAASVLHNNTDNPMNLVVRLGERSTSVQVPARANRRVGFPMEASKAGDMRLTFSVSESSGAPLDSVEARVPVQAPGIDERPALEGSFAGRKEIALNIPASIQSPGGLAHEGVLSVHVGEHLWPELGARLGYLLDYPHGCVEQTTSSTLPLLAARDILPRIGVSRFSDEDLKNKIRAGLLRLNSMKTPSGGLAYWPGGYEPNVYGTAYAMRAVVLAKKANIAMPPGLLEGMESYLSTHLLSTYVEPEVRAAIAQSLAELGSLNPAHSDALFDRLGDLSVFGAASQALAFSALPNQNERIDKLLDSVESGFDEQGNLNAGPKHNDFYYYGSPMRTMSQAAMALMSLRPHSKILPRLVQKLADGMDSYTTQATAYSLLALAQQLRISAGEGSPVRLLLDGQEIAASKDLGGGSKEFSIPLSGLKGKKSKIVLESNTTKTIGYMVSAVWRRPSEEAGSLAATSSDSGPDVYRVFTTPKGTPVDLASLHAGDVLRVSVLVSMPSNIDRDRAGYVAITDHLPAGFEPVQTDLATVASVPELEDSHPFAAFLRSGAGDPSHLELHDDRVNVYFDRVWGDYVAASYIVRAVTPGTFVASPASAELMYEANSHGYTDSRKVVIQ